MVKDYGRIEQVRVSKGVDFFKKGLKTRWGLVDYHDKTAPCFFFNINDQSDIDAVKSHEGFKLVFFANARGNDFINEFVGVPDLSVLNTRNAYLNIPKKIKSKELMIEFQHYMMFKPNVLGDKVYCYVGTEQRKHLYGYDLANRIQEKIPYEIVFGMHPNSLYHVKRTYYDNCFVNLNLELSGGGGLSTALELARMGRKTIYCGINNWPCFLRSATIDHIIRWIEIESNKIGTVQPEINIHDNKTDWQDVKFWL